MKPLHATTRGMTLIELLCVIAVIAILAALLLPALNQGKARAERVRCVGNLSQNGVAFLSFAHDHQGQFPMQTPASAGGTMELVNNASKVNGPFYFGYKHFQAISNELGATRVLVCPSDTRTPAYDFASLANQNISYFVGVNAIPHDSASYLAGDRNLTNTILGSATALRVGPGLRWGGDMHQFKGNILYADGHVAQLNGPGLPTAMGSAGTLPQVWVPTPNLGTGNASSPTPSPTPTANPPPPSTPNRILPPNPLVALPPEASTPSEIPEIPRSPYQPVTPAQPKPGASPSADSGRSPSPVPVAPAPEIAGNSNPIPITVKSAMAEAPRPTQPSPLTAAGLSRPRTAEGFSVLSSLFLLLLLLLLLALLLLYGARRYLRRWLTPPKIRHPIHPQSPGAIVGEQDLD